MQEIIEAIKQTYGEDSDITIDCLLLLSKCDETAIQHNIIRSADMALDKIGRCHICGTKMETQTNKQWHQEVEQYEILYDTYCPKCDMGDY